MSPHIMIELAETRIGAQKFERGYRQAERELTNLIIGVFGAQNNERHLVSRNKREGWYIAKRKAFRGGMLYMRAHHKDLGLRYRKQSGAQYMRIKPRGKF